MDRAGVPPRFQQAHLETNCQRFGKEPGKRRALEAAAHLAEHGALEQRDRRRFCLLLSGDYGTGKTWLASACFTQLLFKKKQGLWRKFYSFIRDVQSCYSPAAERSVDQVLSEYQKAPILLLDDVGDLERDVETEDRRRLLYEVLDYRSDYLLPTILTTNLSGEALREQFGERTMQRVLEMCALVGMDGANLRLADLTD